MDITFTFDRLFFWIIFQVSPILVFLCLVIVILGQFFCRIEKWNKFDGLYWSLITATTVGYGNFRPLGKISKTLSVLIALVGMIFTGVIVAAAISTATIALENHVDSNFKEKIKSELQSMIKSLDTHT